MDEALSLRASLVWTREVLVQWRQWTRSHWRMTLTLSVLAFVVGWVWNTYLMAVVLDGSQVSPGTQTAATADGHTGNALFWLLLFSLAGGLVTYAWSRGWKNFWADVAALPRRLGEAMNDSRSGAFAMLLWGASVSLVISTVISSAVSLALGLVLLALATTPVGVILNFALIRAWRGLCGIVTPNADARLAVMVSPFMVMIGEALGLFVDWMVGGWLVGLSLGVGCAVVSVILVRAAPPPSAAVLLIVACALVTLQVLRMRWAYADDGGWSECTNADGRPCSASGLAGIPAWLRSPGAGHVVARGSLGAIFAAIGAVLGIGIGGAVAGLAVAAAQASGSGRPAHRRSGGAGEQERPDPAQQPDSPERGRVYKSSSSRVDPQERGGVYRSASTGTGSTGHSAPPSPGSDAGSQPSSGHRPTPQPAPRPTSQPTSGPPPQPGPAPTPQPSPGPAPQPSSSPSHGHHQYGNIEDILPEEPDREDDENDENDEGPSRRTRPQR